MFIDKIPLGIATLVFGGILAVLAAFGFEMFRVSRLPSDHAEIEFTHVLYATTLRREQVAFLEQDNVEATLDVIGCGDSATVYRAHLQDSLQEVDIKKIVLGDPDTTEYQHLVDQVEAEIEIGKRVRHRNVVPLLALVSTPRCVYLVFEFVRNLSLNKILTDVRERDSDLDWPLKYKIALGVASGIEYLNQGVNPNVIHRDVKPENILLDQDIEARIADFGLAITIPDTKYFIRMPNSNGTVGYIDPEYFNTRELRRCSDVSSFGIFLVEMVMLMSPSSLTDTTLVQVINNNMNLDDPISTIAPMLKGSEYEKQVIGVVKLAIRCTQPTYSDRPTSHEAKLMLESLK